MKKLIYLFLIFLISCSNQNDISDQGLELESENKGESMSEEKVYNSAPDMNIDLSKNYTATLETNLGKIKIEFFVEDAPNTVNNFVSLSNDGYYNGVIFHRVINGFMIQGGDPSGTGHGDFGKYPGYEFEDELNNKIAYEKGIVAMANRGPNTNGSQFFIMHQDYPLPYQYTIFGKVVEGLDVVDKIANVQTGEADKPIEDVVIETVVIAES
tara:strand:- start:624 stop:1259 length:636 start_codon:yes stop_codon:yes gene_type:complete